MRHLFAWIWVLLVFQFLDEIFNFWPSNHFMCFNIVNTLIKGQIMWKSSWYEPWFDSDERLTKLLKWVWWNFESSWVCELFETVRHFCSVRVDERCEILYISFALVLAVLSFYLFLTCRRLVRALDLHMIGIELFSTFSWGIMCFVSVVLSFWNCLWQQRSFISRDLVLAFLFGFWISWMSLVFILLLLIFF